MIPMAPMNFNIKNKQLYIKMKLIILLSLISLTFSQSNNTSLNVANDKEQNIFLLIVCSIVIIAILLFILYEKCCIYWNRGLHYIEEI